MRSIIEDDFLGATTDAANTKVHSRHCWDYSGVGTPVTPAPQNSSSGSPGIIRITTSGATNDTNNLALGSASDDSFLAADVQRFKIRLAAVSLTSCRMLWGLGSSIGSDTFGSDSLYFIFDTAVDATVRFVSRAGGVQTSQSTGFTMSAQLTSYEFVRVSASIWHAFLTTNGGARSYVGAATANIPTATMGLGVRVVTLTTAARSADIDLISLQTRDLTLR